MNIIHQFIHQISYKGWMVMICLVKVSDNQYQIFFNALLGHSQIVIKKLFLHEKSKISDTNKRNLDKYIAHFPRLIFINIPNCFVKTLICRNTDELCRRYGGLGKNCISKSLCIPMEHTAILVLFPLKYIYFLIAKILTFLF